MSHENFKDNGISGKQFEEKLSRFRDSVQLWNKEVCGMVEVKKRHILAKLNGIQKSAAYPFSKFLRNLKTALQYELEEILKWEEAKWFQKVRTEWINSGDRNT